MEAGDFDPVDLSTSGRSYSDILREQQVLRESGGSDRFLDDKSREFAGLGNLFLLYSGLEVVAATLLRLLGIVLRIPLLLKTRPRVFYRL